jgi:hypothetical protein
VTVGQSRRVVPELFGPRLATAEEVLAINARVRHGRLGSSLDESRLQCRLDLGDKHCVFPFLKTAGEQSGICRCYLWFKEADRQARTLVVMDAYDDDLRGLPRIEKEHLNRLVLMLLEELPIVLLSEG